MSQVGRGSYSVVRRPKTLAPDQESYVIKNPVQSADKQARKKVRMSYVRQKATLDKLHAQVPRASPLFPKSRINWDGSVRMTDFGNRNLNHARKMSLSFQDVYDIFRQLKAGIVSMIGTGIAHRDIKNDNIMVWRAPNTGRVRVAYIDFNDSETKENVLALNTFSNFGTIEYMSPELLARRCAKNNRKGSWDEYVANDLWALGVVFYRLLYGRHPINTFQQRDPYFWKSFRPDMRCVDPRVDTLLSFYNDMRDYPEIYNSLFLPISEHEQDQQAREQKEQLVNDAKALLSLDPRRRLAWLENTTREYRFLFQKQTRRPRQQQQQEKPSTKRIKLASTLQEKKKS